jgi:hypothetical protein
MRWGTSLQQVTPRATKIAPSADEPQMTTAEENNFTEFPMPVSIGEIPFYLLSYRRWLILAP